LGSGGSGEPKVLDLGRKTGVALEAFWKYKTPFRAMPRQAKPFTAIRHIAPDGSTAIVVPKHSMSANY
jgi:hypothetical protein